MKKGKYNLKNKRENKEFVKLDNGVYRKYLTAGAVVHYRKSTYREWFHWFLRQIVR